MSDLRSKLIRLAHENPALRPHLLPILRSKTAAAANWLLPILERNLRELYKDLQGHIKLLEKSPASKDEPGAVVPTLIRDLKKLALDLDRLVGRSSPYAWDVIDPFSPSR